MYTQWLVYAAIFVAAFGFGYWRGGRSEGRYWRDHAAEPYRSAVCSHSQFYYVVPEYEYMELELDHNYLTRLKEECGIDRD